MEHSDAATARPAGTGPAGRLSGDRAEQTPQLETLLDFSGRHSIPLLEMDPRFDAVRDHPAYRQLVEKYG